MISLPSVLRPLVVGWTVVASIAATGCIGGAEAKTRTETVGETTLQDAAEDAVVPDRPSQRWRFSSLVEHGPAGRIGINGLWELGVFEREGATVATLTLVAIDGEPVEPTQERTGSFAFDPRPLGAAEQAAVRGTRWEAARVIDAEVELVGAFAREAMHLQLWIAGPELVGVWASEAPVGHGGALRGSSVEVDPRPLRALEGLPCTLECQALGGEANRCDVECLPQS